MWLHPLTCLLGACGMASGYVWYVDGDKPAGIIMGLMGCLILLIGCRVLTDNDLC